MPTEANKPGFLSSLFQKGTIFSLLLLLLIPAGLKYWQYNEENNKKIRKEVFNQFEISRNIVIDNINYCMQGVKVSQMKVNERLEAREKLVDIAENNKKTIPPNAFYWLLQYTRFDNAPASQDICSLSNVQLKFLRNKLTNIEIKLRNEMNF